MYSTYIFKSNRTVEIYNNYLYLTKVRGLEARLSKYLTVNYKKLE